MLDYSPRKNPSHFDSSVPVDRLISSTSSRPSFLDLAEYLHPLELPAAKAFSPFITVSQSSKPHISVNLALTGLAVALNTTSHNPTNPSEMGSDGNFLIPRTSLRSPSFFGPVTLAAALVLASAFTAPFDEDFSIVKLNDPTFKGTVGMWGACSSYHTENATTANPNATLTGNATVDAIIHKQGKHEGCSPSGFGWSFSLPVNSTGLTSMPLPDSTVGFNIDPSTANTADIQWVEVMSKSDSTMLVVHLAAGISSSLGLLLLVVPYKSMEGSIPSLARFLKVGSLSLLLVSVGCVLSLVSFAVDLLVALRVRNNINAIGNGGGVQAGLGNMPWFAIAGVILMVPSIWSTRGQLGDKR